MRIAAIDIGSNAIRLAIAEEDEIIKKIRIPLRLGAEAFSPSKTFSSSTIELASEVFESIADILKKENVSRYKAYATSAYRDAKNSDELAKAVFLKSGLKIEKISGELEAKIILGSVLHSMELDKKKDYLLFDLGGGSLELSKIEEGQIIGSKSFDLGTVRLMNYKRSVNGDKEAIAKKFLQTQNGIKSFMDNHILESKNLNIIGTGGNFRRILKLRNLHIKKEKEYFNEDELFYIKDELEKLSYLERIKKFELRPDRADVIIPAMEIIGMVIDTLPVKRIYSPRTGLINGILDQILDK